MAAPFFAACLSDDNRLGTDKRLRTVRAFRDVPIGYAFADPSASLPPWRASLGRGDRPDGFQSSRRPVLSRELFVCPARQSYGQRCRVVGYYRRMPAPLVHDDEKGVIHRECMSIGHDAHASAMN